MSPAEQAFRENHPTRVANSISLVFEEPSSVLSRAMVMHRVQRRWDLHIPENPTGHQWELGVLPDFIASDNVFKAFKWAEELRAEEFAAGYVLGVREALDPDCDVTDGDIEALAKRSAHEAGR